MAILLTGGAGFIGSHTAVELLNAGYDVVVADNYSNSDPSVLDRVEQITGKTLVRYEADVLRKDLLEEIFSAHTITAVIHFAGFKAVGESVVKPIEYYRNNLDTTLNLLEVMRDHGCRQFVFSSSATVYGTVNPSPLTEEMTTGGCTNPYGWSKYMIEQILRDAVNEIPGFSVVLLRYFNPVGAHESGLIGEKPNGIPNNLMPFITQVAVGQREKLSVFGNDYPTPDGTGVRDFIHVVDLAKGHVAALRYAEGHTGAEAVNLGTGRGTSVPELVHIFQQVNQVPVPYVIADRRPGDLAECYADAGRARELLGWQAEKTIEDMCRDSWRWEQTAQSL